MSPRTKKAKSDVAEAADVGALSFEDAFEALAAVVAQLEDGELALEEALALFERGQALAARCGQLLDEAELKVKTLAPGGALEEFAEAGSEG